MQTHKTQKSGSRAISLIFTSALPNLYKSTCMGSGVWAVRSGQCGRRRTPLVRGRHGEAGGSVCAMRCLCSGRVHRIVHFHTAVPYYSLLLISVVGRAARAGRVSHSHLKDK